MVSKSLLHRVIRNTARSPASSDDGAEKQAAPGAGVFLRAGIARGGVQAAGDRATDSIPIFCLQQAAFDEAVATNIEDFGMEVREAKRAFGWRGA